MMSVMSKSLPLRVVITFGNIKKSAGMRSGEQDMPHVASEVVTNVVVRGGVSRKRNQLLYP
jgi:hypothetical protein